MDLSVYETDISAFWLMQDKNIIFRRDCAQKVERCYSVMVVECIGMYGDEWKKCQKAKVKEIIGEKHTSLDSIHTISNLYQR